MLTPEIALLPAEDRSAAGRSRRPHRRTRFVALALGLVSLMAAVSGTTAYAVSDPTYDDVPFDHQFSDDIEWLAGSGIAQGYTDGTFRPQDAVSRQAMAAFFHRQNEEIEIVRKTETFLNQTGWSSTIFCPYGKRAIAGSGYSNSATGSTTMVNSYPPALYADSAWLVQWKSTTGALVSGQITVTATCIPG